ncbi:helix-turn-helix transcriptional regulator [Longitalea arenae]|uniref:helix-turn-helix transcriptional regulator n=1 Tax=Longitalea arenae TaxID=2812558 RepID=UPI00196767CA|nr:helix-turn-helix transcriptional regulator [Longitalea arenae]
MKKKKRSKEIEKMIQVENIFTWECHRKLTAKEIAKRVGMDVEELKLTYRKWSSRSLHSGLTFVRMQQARLLLEKADRSIHSIAAEVGYTNTQSFSQQFKRMFEYSPREYRKIYYPLPTASEKETTPPKRKRIKRAR